MKNLMLFLTISLVLFSCTENQRARSFGGDETIILEDNKKLVNVTWKQDNLWILTRKMTTEDTMMTYKFQEKSSYGMLEGNIKIIEVKIFLNLT
jgi:hypothetical protein